MTSENCPDESVNLLFPYAPQKGNLDEAILNCLNLVHFQNTDVMGKWATMDNGQKTTRHALDAVTSARRLSLLLRPQGKKTQMI